MVTLCLQDSWRNYTRLVKGYLWIPVFCSDTVQLYNEESRGDTVPKWWDRSTFIYSFDFICNWPIHGNHTNNLDHEKNPHPWLGVQTCQVHQFGVLMLQPRHSNSEGSNDWCACSLKYCIKSIPFKHRLGLTGGILHIQCKLTARFKVAMSDNVSFSLVIYYTSGFQP